MNINYSRIDDNLYLLQYRDVETKYFEGLWSIPEGVTYNSYILETNDGIVVFDTWKRSVGELFTEQIIKHYDPRDVKYLVVHHMEPDHSGSIPHLLKMNPNITLLGQQLTRAMIESFYQVTPNFRPVKDGEVFKVGEYSLKFLHTPWLHWPETIMTYMVEKQFLFTCDAFGSYGIPNALFYDELNSDEKKRFDGYLVKYFANIIGHFRDWVVKNVEKIEQTGLTISMLLPSHGPLYRDADIARLLNIYKLLGAGRGIPGKTLLIYTSMYGFVRDVVEIIEKILQERKVDYNVREFTDTFHSDLSDVIADAYQAQNIIIATSTYEARAFPIARLVSELIIEKTPVNKKLLIIGLYGWGGKAGSELKELFSGNNYPYVDVLEFRAGQHLLVRRSIEEKIDKLFSA
ncbi:MAG: FprA family A-type flavoprotein [Thermosphaera sp.]